MIGDDYDAFDADLIAGRVRWTRDLAIQYAQDIRSHRLVRDMEPVKAISMLGMETLMMCRAYALSARQGVLEIGPYIGGSTVAMGMGLKQGSAARIVSVDTGGTSDNATLPSQDIHADWRRNVERFGVGDVSQLVGGWSERRATRRAVEQIAQGRKFDVLFVDGNGMFARDLRVYRRLLTDDCLLIVDDYHNVQGLNTKQDNVQRQLHWLMLTGRVEQYALTPWSTWFGRLVC